MATSGCGGDDDDALFLSLIDEAEHRAVRSSAKRPPPSSDPLHPSKLPKPQGREPQAPAEGEGSYLAALRGAHSPLWRDLQKPSPSPALPSPSTGSCFRCGSQGHWAKDCTGGPQDPASRPAIDVPDKDCSCGAGRCLVLTSSTARNPGRRFYRCPVKEENGGCNFFEWCDGAQQQPPPVTTVAVHASGGGSGIGDVKCPCGAGWCLVQTAKSGRNPGQNYYKCPAEGARSCGFFKWCNQNLVETQDSSPRNANSQASVGKSSSCFKCGREGHWSRECPMQQSNSSTNSQGVSSASSTTCFKCGKAGHWARDCSAQQTNTRFLK